MSINKVILLGNVGQDPEIRESASGKFATFSLATTDRAYVKSDGTQVPERTEWHNCVANGALAQTIERFVKAGTKLYIEGKIRTRKYTGKDNVERKATSVYIDNLELLGGKPQEQNANVPFQSQQLAQQNQQQQPSAGGYRLPF
jgi:single-strand DNA-binding protein